jgi:hypothetical protein
MKKLMFTAIALIAFSGISVANTIADEEVKKDNKDKTKVIQIKTNPCKGAFSAGLSLGGALGMSYEDSWSLAETFYAICERRNSGI